MGDAATIIQQLNSARDIVLRDAAVYPQVVPGVLPVIAAEQSLSQRIWGSDFLAETFASPVLNAEEKQKLCVGVLDTLKGYLNRQELMGEDEDPSVVKSAVQCAASIYPLVFRHTISQKEDSETWAKMMNIKSGILRRMDSAEAGVRICCIKFVARVVQVQTPGLIADPRRQDQNEISLALVPRDHSVLTPSNLEAEASGLLDRLLGVLQDNSQDALIVTATLNALSSLVQRRASISTKILTSVTNFNPLTLSQKTMGGKEKVAVRSMTRTTISFLAHVLKRNPNHPLAARMQQCSDRLRHSLNETFSEQNQLKRSAPNEPIDGLDEHKRQRLEAEVDRGSMSQQQPPPLPSGPVTYAQLYSISQDQGTAGFHAEALPLNIVAQLVHALLAGIDQTRLTQALNAVSSRYLELEQRSPPNIPTAPLSEDEDDDLYSPEEFGDERAPRRSSQTEGATVDLGPFYLPPSPPLTDEEKETYGTHALDRVFETLNKYEQDSKKGKKVDGERGFNRITSAGQDREGWITLLTRLVTRPAFDLADPDQIKAEPSESDTLIKKSSIFGLPTRLRDTMLKYITDNHRQRIDLAITWLNEEWYSDTLLAKRHPSSDRLSTLPNYTSNLSALLETLLLFVDKQDLKILVRFLSEIPALPAPVFNWLKRLADDPERVQMVVGSLQYIVMFRPPARKEALDCVEGLWRENGDARKGCEKLLKTWRPEALQASADGDIHPVKAELN